MKVKAKELGYYNDKRRRVGEVFEVAGDQAFSTKWMEKIEEPAVEESVEVAPEPPKKEAKKPSKKKSEEVI